MADFDHSARTSKHFEPLCGYCVCAHCARLPYEDEATTEQIRKALRDKAEACAVFDRIRAMYVSEADPMWNAALADAIRDPAFHELPDGALEIVCKLCGSRFVFQGGVPVKVAAASAMAN